MRPDTAVTVPGWRQFERDVQALLGLDSTPASGALWWVFGDATDNSHPVDSVFPLAVECKYTEKKSYSVAARNMGHWVDRAQEMGKRFVLAVRLDPPGGLAPHDYAVVPMDDFVELLELARGNRGG